MPLLGDHETKVRNFYHEVHFSKVRDWSIVQEDLGDIEKTTAATEQFSKGDATKEVSKSSAASLMILHDMLELGGRTHQFESSLLPADDGTLTTLSRVDPENETNQFLKKQRKPFGAGGHMLDIRAVSKTTPTCIGRLQQCFPFGAWISFGVTGMQRLKNQKILL